MFSDEFGFGGPRSWSPGGVVGIVDLSHMTIDKAASDAGRSNNDRQLSPGPP